MFTAGSEPVICLLSVCRSKGSPDEIDRRQVRD